MHHTIKVPHIFKLAGIHSMCCHLPSLLPIHLHHSNFAQPDAFLAHTHNDHIDTHTTLSPTHTHTHSLQRTICNHCLCSMLGTQDCPSHHLCNVRTIVVVRGIEDAFVHASWESIWTGLPLSNPFIHVLPFVPPISLGLKLIPICFDFSLVFDTHCTGQAHMYGLQHIKLTCIDTEH